MLVLYAHVIHEAKAPRNGDAMIEPAAHTLRSTRLDLRWWSHGDPAAPLLLLVHGGRDHGRSWDDVAARFADRWHVVAPDLRGHGRSGWSDGGAYMMEDFVYDLDRLCATLGVSAARPATIVGHSLGGNIVIRWTALFPDRVRRLVSIEGLGPAPKDAEPPSLQPMRDWIARRARREDRGLPVYPDIATATGRMRAAQPNLSADLARRLTERGVRDVPGGVSFAYDPLLLAWQPGDTPMAEREAMWAEIACPVLLMHGQDSWASNPATDGRAARFRDARVVSLEGAGHWVHHDRFDAFVETVAGFVTG
jgi:pimeloyl-ACP methyl ester carboxylesterase